MQNKPKSKNVESLLNQYNHEIDKLKEKLLNGESWDNLVENRHDITRLAIAVHQSNTTDGNIGPVDHLQSSELENPIEPVQ